MIDSEPYSNYRLTVRLELANTPGMFAKVAAVLAEEGANLGAVDIVSATAERMVPDVTIDVQSDAHGEKVLARCVGKFKTNGQAVIGVGFTVDHVRSFI